MAAAFDHFVHVRLCNACAFGGLGHAESVDSFEDLERQIIEQQKAQGFCFWDAWVEKDVVVACGS